MSKTIHKRYLNREWQLLLSILFLFTLTLGVGDGTSDVSGASGSFAHTNSAESSSTHKVIAPPGVLDKNMEGVNLWHDYGSFALYRLTDEAWKQLPKDVVDQIQIADHMDQILIDSYKTHDPAQNSRGIWTLNATEVIGPALQLIQFVGPIKDEWLQEVSSTGATPIQYIATNAYLVWADDDSRTQLDEMVAKNEILQLSVPYPNQFKIGPVLAAHQDPDEVVPVLIQMYRHNDKHASENAIQTAGLIQLSGWSPVLSFQNQITTLRVGDVQEIASLPDVFWIEERMERQRMDEVQGQIMAGNLNSPQTGPSSPGYLSWLDSYGFSTNPDDYPIVDITDDGIGNGTINSGDPTLHQFGNIANSTRLAYVANCTSAVDGGGPDGHGHINVSIAGGYDATSGFPFKDPQGYQRGLGINPYGRFAGTRIFDPGFDQSTCGYSDTGVIKSIQDNGAQINSNSWGCSGCAGSYDDSSQVYDVGARDADLTEPGNQEMIFIFSAGNSGPTATSIGTPGNGKNMITVGASENYRPSDEDGSWTDGCFVGPSGADNAMDIISFSSRGPAPGGRVKPELIAPGTHIHGTASTHASYTGNSVCDQYRPSGQTTFAASSGTSHSTPAVAGAASLAYWWLENKNSILFPSPAMMKAYLIAHPTYLTGVSANDTLPSNNQGYGMPNMTAMFDDADKFLLDQSVVFDNSGETWTLNVGVADPTKPIRIVMAYTDAPGAIGTSPQVNDLNLAADLGTSTYLGNVFSGQWSTTGGTSDSANNYEAIYLPAGTTGDIEITIIGFNIAGNGIPNIGDGTDQDFALVCYNCSNTPKFYLWATPEDNNICTPNDAVYNVEVGQILGFSDPVVLSASVDPAGTTVNFSTNPVTPPYSSTLTIGNTAAATSGSYNIEITGTSTTDPLSTTVTLDLYDAAPAAVTLSTPGEDATEVAYKPTFEWTAVPLVSSYYLEVASDPGFTDTVYTATETITNHIAIRPLNALTTFYWRVSAQNVCGSDTSTQSSFTTKSPSLTCNNPAVTFESGIPTDWVVVDNTGGTGIVWTTTGDPACSIPNLTNGSGDAACADSDAAGSGAPAYDTELVLNPFDLTAYTSAAMDVKAYYRDYILDPNDRFEVDVWDGISWNNELSWDEDHDPEDINLNLSTYAGLSTVQVHFRYFGNGYDWYAQVDDISITCAAPEITVKPPALTLAQQPSIVTTLPITITNNGNGDLSWNILEADCDTPTDIPWLSVAPDNGVNTPAGNTNVDVTFDSTGFPPDTYNADLCISSNDPITPSVAIPVEMTVESGGITITMSPFPTDLLEPGGDVEYTIAVTNTSSAILTIESLVDSEFDLSAHCTDAVGTLLSPTETYRCTVSEFVAGNAGDEHVNLASVTASDIVSNVITSTATALVSFLNVDPDISLTRDSSQYNVNVGDTIVFTSTVINKSVGTDPVTIYSLVDDIYGDLTSVHDEISTTTCSNGITIQPGDSYTCTYTVKILDFPTENLTTTVTVTGIDDEGIPAMASEKITLILDYLSLYLPLLHR